MQRRFLAVPAVRATDLLLQERVPKVTPFYPHAIRMDGQVRRGAEGEAMMRVFSTPDLARPEVHLLSNGRYHVMVNNAGAGYSRWRDLEVTRWREDPVADGLRRLLLRPRRRERPLLVDLLPADARAGREVRGDLPAGAGRVPAARRRVSISTPSAWSLPRTTSSCGASGSRTGRGGRARSSSTSLRRGRDRPDRARRGPPGFLEPLRDDRTPPRPERDTRDPAPPLLGRATPLARPHHGRRRPCPSGPLRSRPTGRGSSVGAIPSPTRSRWWTHQSSRTPLARSWTRSWLFGARSRSSPRRP